MSRTQPSYDTFIAANADGLLRTAYLLSWDEREAEDLVQECLFKVATRWSRVSGMEQPLAYVRRVLINLATDDAKRRSRHRMELSGSLHVTNGWPARHGTAVCDEPDLEERDELMAALGALASRQRAVLVLRYFLDLPEADTARALGCSVGTVKSTASKALARVRAQLEPNRAPLPEVTGS
jgi:RNA polymerase sigma-70 factor (sigma-E family)